MNKQNKAELIDRLENAQKGYATLCSKREYDEGKIIPIVVTKEEAKYLIGLLEQEQTYREKLMWVYANSIGSDSIDGLHVCDNYLEWENSHIKKLINHLQKK